MEPSASNQCGASNLAWEEETQHDAATAAKLTWEEDRLEAQRLALVAAMKAQREEEEVSRPFSRLSSQESEGLTLQRQALANEAALLEVQHLAAALEAQSAQFETESRTQQMVFVAAQAAFAEDQRQVQEDRNAFATEQREAAAARAAWWFVLKHREKRRVAAQTWLQQTLQEATATEGISHSGAPSSTARHM